MARCRRADQPGADQPHQGARSRLRLLHLLQLPLSPLVPRLPRGGVEGDPGADRGTRRRARARHLPAGVPRHSRVHVQLVRGARADPGRRRTTSRCRAWWSASAPRFPSDRTAAASARSSTCAIASRSTSAASTRTRAASSCSSSSSTTARRWSTACTWCWSARRTCPFPKHPRIHHLGFLEDQDKYDAMAAAELLIMPSYLESLSMVALEAWAMGKPVLANAKCDVLQGQCIRSNAGLFYDNFHEFAETLRAIDAGPSLQAALGRNGRAFFERNYAWPVIEKKYVDMLEQLSKETPSRTMEPMPGLVRAPAPLAAARRQRRQAVAGRALSGSEKPEVRSREASGRPPSAQPPAPSRPQPSGRQFQPRAIAARPPAAISARGVHDQRRPEGDGRRQGQDGRPPRRDDGKPQGRSAADRSSRQQPSRRQQASRPKGAARAPVDAAQGRPEGRGRDRGPRPGQPARRPAAASRPQAAAAAAVAERSSGHRHPPGARDAGLRRCDRQRGAGHPARAAGGRLRVGDLRPDRRPPARGPDRRLPGPAGRRAIPTTS